MALMNDLNETVSSFSTLNDNKFIDLIFYGSDRFDDKKNRNINVHHKIHQTFSKTWSTATINSE